MKGTYVCPLQLPHKNDVRFVLYLQLFVGGLMSYLRLFVYSGVQRILCCVFVLFVFVLCTLYCQFLWIVNLWLPFSVFSDVYLKIWLDCKFSTSIYQRKRIMKPCYILISCWNRNPIKLVNISYVITYIE